MVESLYEAAVVHGDIRHPDFFNMSPQAVQFYVNKKFPQPEVDNLDLMTDVRDKAIAEGFNVA